MVSGIVGVLDIAPTLHFVEPGVKINGEEWIKVMEENNVPNSAALMELGRKLLLLPDNAPSHTCKLACDQNKTVLHGTVPLQPPCCPDLSPLVEGAQDTARSVPNSCQSRRIAGTFDPRVSQNADRQPLDVCENGQCLGPQVKGMRCRQKLVFSSSTEHDTFHRHRQHIFQLQMEPLYPQRAPGPIFALQNPHFDF